MKVISSVYQLTVFLANRSKKDSLGFIPTMGALHKGHASLIKRSLSQNALSICSIFVNPTQFNRQEDFKSYPNSLTEDLTLLEKINCDLVYIPDISDLYQENEKAKIGDQVVFDYSATADGNKFEGSDGKGVQLELGKDLFFLFCFFVFCRFLHWLSFITIFI